MEQNSQKNFILKELEEDQNNIELFYSYLEHEGIDTQQEKLPLTQDQIKERIDMFKNKDEDQTDSQIKDSVFIEGSQYDLDQLNSSDELDQEEQNDDLKTRVSQLFDNQGEQDIQVHELEIENQMDITELFKETNVQCEIHSFQIKKKKMFFKNQKQVKYKLITKPLNWEVLRTYKDFLALQQSLIRTFPLNFVSQQGTLIG